MEGAWSPPPGYTFAVLFIYFFARIPRAALLSTRPGGERGEVGLRLTRPAPPRSSGPRRGRELRASAFPAGLYQPLAPARRTVAGEIGNVGEGVPLGLPPDSSSPRLVGGARQRRILRAQLGRSRFPGSAFLLFRNFPSLSRVQ